MTINSPGKQAEFFKYQAMGNDIVVIDPARFDASLTPSMARLICHRHFGLGADGICYGPLSDAEHSHKMRFFNPDGTEAEKSGNGLRIFARYLWDAGYVLSREFEVWMHGTVIPTAIQDKAACIIAMAVGSLSFAAADIPVNGPSREVTEEILTVEGTDYCITAVSVGNPHCVIFLPQLLNQLDISAELTRTMGATIEVDPLFPNRTNVQFVRVLDRHTIQIEIWERGAGYTLASGTSSSAAAGAAIKTGRCDSPVEVRMAGGTAHVAVDTAWQVTLTGSVEAVCQGTFAPDLMARMHE